MKELNNLTIDEKDKTTIKNHGGGHLNHSLFWNIMNPEKSIDEKLTTEIEKTFGSLETFKKLFSDAAASQFGSGWAWLIQDDSGALQVYS